MDIIACDIFIIGGGLATARAIRRLLEQDVSIRHVAKGRFGSISQRGVDASDLHGRTPSPCVLRRV